MHERAGNAIQLFAPGGKTPIHAFRFGRQRREEGLCLSDYIHDPADAMRDHLAIFRPARCVAAVPGNFL